MRPRPSDRTDDRPDSQVVSPDPRISIKDVRRLNDGGRPISDNVAITDKSLRNNKWENTDQYNKKIDSNFKYTDKNWKEAYNEAVRTGKPLVVVFGSENTNDTERLIDGPAKAGNQTDRAIHMFVDKSRVDKGSDLGKYVNHINSLGVGDTAYTGIFALRPGEGGKPELGKLVANTWGARSEISNVIDDQLKYAEKRMQDRKGKFSLYDEADEKPQDNKPQDKTKPDEKTEKTEDKTEKVEPKEESEDTKLLRGVLTQRNEIFNSIAKGGQAFLEDRNDFSALERALKFQTGTGEAPKLTLDQREALFDKAVETSDQVDPKETQKAREILDQQVKDFEEKGKGLDGADKQENQRNIQMLKLQRQSMDLLDKASGISRVERGLFKLDESNFDDGIKDIKEGFRRNPELAKNQAYIDRLARSPYLTQDLEKEFPDMHIGEARERLEKEQKEKGTESDTNPNDKETETNDSTEEQQDIEPTDKKETPPNDQGEKVDEGKEVDEKPEKNLEVEEREAAERLLKSAGEIKRLLGSITANTSFEDAQAIYGQAMNLAQGNPSADGAFSGINMADLKTVENKFKREIDSTSDSAVKANLQAQLTGLNRIGQSKDAVQIQQGRYLIDHASDHPERFSEGIKKIGAVAKNYPEVMQNDQFAEKIIQTGLETGSTAAEIKEALPFESIDKAIEKLPKKFKVTNPEGLEEPKKMAHFLGKDLAMKFGASWCEGCVVSETSAYPDEAVQKTLKESSVFVNMDLSEPDQKYMDFVKGMGVEGLPTNMVARPQLKADGSIELEEIGRTGSDFIDAIEKISELSGRDDLNQAQKDAMRKQYSAEAARALNDFYKKNLR